MTPNTNKPVLCAHTMLTHGDVPPPGCKKKQKQRRSSFVLLNTTACLISSMLQIYFTTFVQRTTAVLRILYHTYCSSKSVFS